MNGCESTVSLFYTLGAHLELRNDTGLTPLLCAVWSGSIETVQYLLNCGAEIQATDITERNVLHLATQRKHHKLLEILLEKKEGLALINQTDNNNSTPLHYATFFSSVKVNKKNFLHLQSRFLPLHFEDYIL